MEGMACGGFIKDSANMGPTLVLLIEELWSLLLCECMGVVAMYII